MTVNSRVCVLQGELIRDTPKIASNYMQFWFWIDAAGTIPLDSFVEWGGVDTSEGDYQALAALKILRMLRLARCAHGLLRARAHA